MTGHVMLTSVALSASVPPYRAGKAKMLAVGSARRLPQIPEVPTTAEMLPGYEAVTWFGLFTTAGTPQEIIAKINAQVRALFNEQAFVDRFIVPNMFEPMVTTPEEFAGFIKRGSAKWAKVLKEANIKVD
jgi:tripartite-type tricarboxylate transporter receptor subunit TctC